MSIRSSAIGLAVVVVLMGAGTAQSLTGSNTVFTDDIADAHVRVADIGAGAVGSSEIIDNSIRSSDIGNDLITGDDVNESTLALPVGALYKPDDQIPPGTYAYEAHASLRSPGGVDNADCVATVTPVVEFVNSDTFLDLAPNVDTLVVVRGWFTNTQPATISIGCLGGGANAGPVHASLIRLGEVLQLPAP